jgi:hypothetical protein
MGSDEVASNFTDAFNKLGLQLREKGDFDAYYVLREDSPIMELKQMILMDDSASKILCTGHRASGKTTELRRLMFMLDDKYFVVYFSAMDALELADIDYKDVLLCMVLQTLRSIEEHKVKISEDIVEDMHLLLTQLSGELVVSKVEERARGFDIGGKLRALVVEMGGRFKSETVTRGEIRRTAEHLIQDVLQRFDLLIAELQERTKKPLLIIVDDLEKADLAFAEKIFYEHAATLTRPSCKAIFTFPVSLAYAPSWRQVEMNFPLRPCVLPLKSVKKKDGCINREGVDFLKNIVWKRVSSELFDDDALEKLASWSGGIVVDFLRMVRDCCVKAEARDLERVDVDLAGEAFDYLINDYGRPLEEKYYPKLAEVYQKKDAKIDEELRFLLHLLAILEYDKGRWYDVHPAVEQILFEKGLIKS